MSNLSSPSIQTNKPELHHALTQWQTRVERALLQYLPPLKDDATHLHQAMQYACLNGGKRLRPLLVYATGLAFDAPLSTLDIPTCAVEAIHAYSLIHDDLPAMDNSDLRRGKPTCHKAFDEATAILAGDALQALAFHLLFQTDIFTDAQQARMAKTLGQAAMAMVDGQALDLYATDQTLTQAALDNIHKGKTGALIRASVLLGAIAANVQDEATLLGLDTFATHIGLAFQIQDDILDVTASTEALGKPQGQDATLNKNTYPDIIGLAASQARAHALIEASIDALRPLSLETSLLADLAWYVVKRTH